MDAAPSPKKKKEHSQFGLLREKRFAPFFWTQFAGAFNDNIYKNVLILIIAFQAAGTVPGRSDILINMAAGLFILPFFLFSAFAGQIADKYEKSRLIRVVKLCEIVIMIAAAVALYFTATTSLMVLLFFMGTQSTFFGPVKYSIIPQHLDDTEIIGGNALVEMGTFVSILLGTIAGGILAQQDRIWPAAAVIVTAVCGWLFSRGIPEAKPADPDLNISWNPLTQSFRTLGYAAKDRTVLLSIMGISWFWFLGASYLTQIPNYTKNVLHGSESVATLLLAMFSIGIGAGSLLCERLSGKKVEYGLVPIGSLGLSIFGLDLALSYHAPDPGRLLGVLDFIRTPGSIRVLSDLILIGIFGGLYIVPLFALVQTRSEIEVRSRIIAANNIMNALFMVVAAACGALFLGVAGLSIPQFFGVLVLMNLTVAVFIYSLVPEFTMRCLIWLLTHVFYRIRHENLDLIPTEGPAVIVCNHVSYVDALIIASLVRRPVRFVTFKGIYDLPVLNFIFRTGKAIPIDSRSKNPDAYEKAFDTIARELEDGQIVGIFPEGMLTKTGEINEFKNGIDKILARNPVPVVPSALCGLWGSFFSHKGGPALTRLPRRFFSLIHYRVGRVLTPDEATAPVLWEHVARLRGDDK
ncbi:MFS transporter [Desulfatiferula olefinivorans]